MQTENYGIEAFWQQSDIVIKTVAGILLLMSIWSWFIIVVRACQLLYVRHFSKNIPHFWHTQSFSEGLHLLDNRQHNSPFYLLALEGQSAIEHHSLHQNDLHGLLPLTEWLTSCLRDSIDGSAERLQRGLSILASIGSTSPFIGLFGTVWGIYHALVSISTAGQSSINAVAGPVGEALIMTAFGLVVAIPAVLGYNAINRSNRNLLNKLNRFAHQLHAYFITGAVPKNSKKSIVAVHSARKLAPQRKAG